MEIQGEILEAAEPKPGYKTTEWITTIAPWIIFAGLLVLVGIGRVELADIDRVLSFLGIGGGVGNAYYSYSRAKVKASQ